VNEINMRLPDFILANVETILVEWEAFARSIWPEALNNPATDPATLRDHAAAILHSSAREMNSLQTVDQQVDKSKGEANETAAGVHVDMASEKHGLDRYDSGFELWAVISEYRALRASVIRLWRESKPEPNLRDLDDVTRFNECMDQSLTEAVRSYSEQVARDRETLLENEREARKEAEHANRAKDTFLATLSHELRTPLSAIVGWVSILRMNNCSELELAEGLDVIERSTKAQVQLIEDVLDVSRIVSGKLRLEISPCDLVELIKAGVDSVRPAAEAKGIRLDCQLDPAASQASCDPSRITQIVWNLLSNSMKFTGKGGCVRVTLNRDGSDLRICVSDDGLGINADLLPYVFDRFRQADSSSRRQYGGLGLGLSIVKNVVEMHGGTVEAQSAGEGHGSTFIIRLPIRAVIESDGNETVTAVATNKLGESKGVGVDAPSCVRLDGIRVLVVDDQPDARHMLLKVLEAMGAQVTLAASSAEALAALAESKAKNLGPDLLVSDVGMPDQDGYDLLREVRRLGHHATELPAIALTAFAHDGAGRDAAAAGFQVHLPKPVNTSDLTAVIASLAGHP
jgi:signal transduction histidine kinase/ActR/RegA family two-component response regulator